MWGFIIALLSGAMMSIQGVFNTGLTKQTSIWLSAAFVQFTALIVCIIAWFVTGKNSSISEIFKVNNKLFLTGGIIGALITYTVIKSTDLLGPAKAVMFIVTAQLIIAYLIELFGLFGIEKVQFEWRKFIGLIVTVIGVITFKWD